MLKIQPMEWLNPIITDYKTYEAEYLTLEPEERLAATGTEGRLSSIRTRWLESQDANQLLLTTLLGKL
jgi:hypothetical protein